MYNSGNSSKNVTGASVVDGTLYTVDIADDAVTEAKIADAAVVSLKSGRKNLIMNGGFDVWQRGETFTGVREVYTADRWYYTDPYGITATITRGEGAFGQILNVASAASGGGNDPALVQRIEDVKKFSAKTITLSFYVKALVAETLAVKINQNLNNAGTGDVLHSSSIILSTEWQKFSFTTTMGDTQSSTINAGSSLDVKMFIGGATANTVSYSEVQLELGSVATDFEHRSYGEELALCQRYYQKYSNGAGTLSLGNGNIRGSNSARMSFSLKSTMRTNPTYSSSGVDALTCRQGTASYITTSHSATNLTPNNVELSPIMSTSPLNATAPFLGVVTANAWIAFDAEL